jgi:hypothetical protein
MRIPVPDTQTLGGAIMIRSLVMLLIGIIFLSSCATSTNQQMSNIKQIRYDIATSNIELDQIIEE